MSECYIPSSQRLEQSSQLATFHNRLHITLKSVLGPSFSDMTARLAGTSWAPLSEPAFTKHARRSGFLALCSRCTEERKSHGLFSLVFWMVTTKCLLQALGATTACLHAAVTCIPDLTSDKTWVAVVAQAANVRTANTEFVAAVLSCSGAKTK